MRSKERQRSRNVDIDLAKLRNQIFDADMKTYAVIDGASAPMLLGKLDSVEYACLLRGELSLDLAEAAPYLVELKENCDFTSWLIKYSQQKKCCIYIQSTESIFSVRKHCRFLLKAELPNKSIVYFRFYDPRVIDIYIKNCNFEEKIFFLGETISKVLIFSKMKVVCLTSKENLLAKK